MGLLDRFRQPPAPARTEKGRSGTSNLRGFLNSEELNRNLAWPRNLEIYDEMRRTDPTIRWMLALAKNPILAAEPEVEPASQEPDDLERAAFVEHALAHELDGGLHSFLRQALLYLDFGHYVFERVADVRPVEFSFEDTLGEETDVAREAFVIAKLAPRKPRTIQRWVTKDGDPSQLVAIEQWLDDPDGPQQPEIPADRLVIFTNEMEGDDYRGTSLLRSAYKAYRYKCQLENLEAIALERSVGMPVLYAPGATGEEQDQYEQMLEGIRQGENLWALIPKPKYDPQHQADGVLLEDLAISGDGTRSANGNTAAGQAIQRHEAAMARNVLAEFMRLGHENTGARATGDVQQDPYYQAIESYARYIEQVINEQVVAPLVAWNYQGGRLPKLRFSKIQAKNVQVVAQAFAQLVKEGALIPDLETENWLRSILDAPRRKPDDGEEDPYRKPSDPPPTDPNKIDPATGQPYPPDKPPPGEKPKPSEKLSERFDAPYPIEVGARVAESDMDLSLGRSGTVIAEDVADNGAWIYDVRWDDGSEDKGRRQYTLRRLDIPGHAHALAEWRPSREPTEHERSVAFADIARTLDALQDELLSAAVAASREPVSETLTEAVAVTESGAVERLTVDGDEIKGAVLGVLEDAYRRGRMEVAAELRRQGSTARFEEVMPDPHERLARLTAMAATVAASIAAQATRAIRAFAIRRLDNPRTAPVTPGHEPDMAVRQAARGGALSHVAAAFNAGRRDEMLSRRGEIKMAVYSALLDQNTCSQCREADGREGPVGGDPELPAPNPFCEGGGACRCMWVPILKTESGATAYPEGFPEDVALPEAA